MGVSYALLHETSARDQLEKKISQDVNRPGLMEPGKARYDFEPLATSYFSADNAPIMKKRSPVFIKVVSGVCGIVLLIAIFNFINLFLLFGQNRKKEIGIKKTLGVTPKALFTFCIVEASVYITISCTLALLTAALLLPHFNNLFNTSLSPDYFMKWEVVTPIASVIFL